MSKTYLPFKLVKSLGVVSYDTVGLGQMELSTNKIVSVALDSLLVWNAKTSSLEQTLEVSAVEFSTDYSTTKAEISAIAIANPQTHKGHKLICAGRKDGYIELWKYLDGSFEHIIKGSKSHKKSVSAIAFNQTSTIMATGSVDNTITLWDLISLKPMFKLRGHTNSVTNLRFVDFDGATLLISSSKDKLLRVWDIEQQVCLATLTGHLDEIWSFDVLPRDLFGGRTIVVTGSSDNEIRGFELVKGDSTFSFVELGSLEKSTVGRVTSVVSKRTGIGDGVLLFALSSGGAIEIFSRLDEGALAKKVRKIEKKTGKKPEVLFPLSFKPIGKIMQSGEKILPNFLVTPNALAKGLDVFIASTKNSIQRYRVKYKDGGNFKIKPVSQISSMGNSSTPMCLEISSDDRMFFSLCLDGDFKVWSLKGGALLNHFNLRSGQDAPLGDFLCGTFLPGNRYVLAGTRKGYIVLADVDSQEIIYKTRGHIGPIWRVELDPTDSSVFATGSIDKEVKFWELEMDENENLSFYLARRLKIADGVTTIRYSKCGKYLAVGLLDSTVKVFYRDTLKFYLTLYGHKLPVLTMDFSADGSIIVTGSADKNIKVWGLDFGDCHKSLFVHDDSVTGVRFIRDTRYIITIGKDGVVKYLDLETYDTVQSFRRHYKANWGLSINASGTAFVTSSEDRTIKMWRLDPDDRIYIEFEKKDIEDRKFDREIIAGFEKEKVNEEKMVTVLVGGGREEILGMDTRDMSALRGSERLLSTLELIEKEGEKSDSTSRSPMFLGLSDSEYLLRVVRSLEFRDLEEGIAILPFRALSEFTRYLVEWMEMGVRDFEVSARLFIKIIERNVPQIMGNNEMLMLVSRAEQIMSQRLGKIHKILEFNREAIEFTRKSIEDEKKFDVL